MLFYIVYVKLIYYENKWVLNKLYCDKLEYNKCLFNFLWICYVFWLIIIFEWKKIEENIGDKMKKE